MRLTLWPDESDSHAREIAQFLDGTLTNPRAVFVAHDERGTLLGFIELSIRTYLDGCDTDHVVAPRRWGGRTRHRRRGVGRASSLRAENWGPAQGSREFGSDTNLHNEVSTAARLALASRRRSSSIFSKGPRSQTTTHIDRAGVDAREFLALVTGRRGHFQMESGHHGALWLDSTRCSPNRLSRRLRRRPCRGASALQRRCHLRRAGRGAFLAQLLARSLGVEFCYTEMLPAHADGLYQRTYRLPHAFATRVAGKRVAIVDDVMSAGSALRGTFAALQANAVVPVVAGALLVLGEKGASFFADHGVPVVAAARDDYEMWPPADCPLCAQGVPLETLLTT